MPIGQHSIRPTKGSTKRRKRLGAGNASGKGTYSGRGVKGQTSRTGGKRRPGFEGGQTTLVQRMPKLRGFKNPNRVPYQVVNIDSLRRFENGTTVDVATLYESRLITKKIFPVKLLGDGKLNKKLTIIVDAASKSAIRAVKDSGGTITLSK